MSNASPPGLAGVFPAVLTPQTADLSPDHEALAKHCRWLLDNGCNGLAVLGTTGEGNAFSVDERIAIIEGLIEAGIAGETLLPGTGCCALSDTVRLTRRAVELGVAGVLMLPPFYYKNVSDEGLFAAFAEAIERIGDSRLKVYLYHFPQMSAVPLSLALIERLLKAYPETVVGMKDSSGDFDNMSRAAYAFPGFSVFSGADQLLLPLLREGGAGCITAVANIASSLAAEIYAGWREPAAEEVQERLTAVRAAVYAFAPIPALKEIMARHTGESAWRHLRPALVALDETQGAELMRGLEATGYALPPAP